MRVCGILGVLVVIGLIGCGSPSADTGSPSGSAGVMTPGAPRAESPATETPGPNDQGSVELGATPQVEANPAAEESPPAEVAPPIEPAMPPAESGTERVKAEAGVGAKGRSLDEHEGLLVTPAKAYFSARERIVFDAAVPKALQLYEATNGNAPRSHEEFMTQVIQAQGIQLPELPAGQRYVYDPETKELMVERPAR